NGAAGAEVLAAMIVAVHVAVLHVLMAFPPASVSVTVGLVTNPPTPPMPLQKLLATLRKPMLRRTASRRSAQARVSSKPTNSSAPAVWLFKNCGCFVNTSH